VSSMAAVIVHAFEAGFEYFKGSKQLKPDLADLMKEGMLADGLSVSRLLNHV